MTGTAVFQGAEFMHPWVLLLLAAVPVVLLAELFAGAPGALRVSTGETLARIAGRYGGWRRGIPPVLRALGLALLIVALARPIHGLQPRRDLAEVIDIMLCVDVSASMTAQDFEVGGRRVDRLYVTKRAVEDFIESRKTRADDRYGVDRVGLVLYAAYAWTQTPLTRDYGLLEKDIREASIDERDPSRQRTAIGSAIGLAVSKLRKSEAVSKVIILLTDGRNNAGEIDPITAAQVAEEYGIRIYTIGAGTKGETTVRRNDIFGITLQMPTRLPIDEDTLREIADRTNGQYFRATDTESLRAAYAEINEMERTEIEVDDYYEHEEGFVPWAVAGGLALAVSIFSRRLWFEPIP
jgi:Ca-activated chloride channel family protein